MKLFPMFLAALVCALPSLTYAETQDVIWQAKTNTTVGSYSPGSGSTLSKTTGTVAFNADAISVQTISGDGSIEFRFDQTNKRMGVGLSFDNTSSGYGELDFGIVANMSGSNPPNLVAGNLIVRENGANTASVGTFVVTDVFKIERIGTTIKYWKNTTLLRTATVRSLGSLIVDNSFYDLSGSISGCKITATGKESDVMWDRAYSVPTYPTPDLGSGYKHTTNAAVWEGARSARMFHGDGYVKFRFANTAKRMAVGLAPTDPNYDIVNIPYGIEATGTTNNFRVFDADDTLGTGTFAVSDVFTVKRSGTTVTFYKNDVLIGTSDDPSTGRLYVDLALYTASAEIDGCRYSGFTDSEPVFGDSDFTSDGVRRLRNVSSNGAWTWGSRSPKMIHRAGQVEFRIGHTDKILVTGLSNTDADTTDVTVQLGLKAHGNGTVQVIESGTLIGAPLSFVPSDRFVIRRTDQTVFYEKNGVPFYQHALTGALGSDPLLVDVAIYTQFGEINDVHMSGVFEHALRRNPTGVTTSESPSVVVDGAYWGKTNTSAGWNSGAVSQQIIWGDGAVEFSPFQANKLIAVGLSSDDSDFTGAFRYAIHVSTTGTYSVQENGVTVPGVSGSYTGWSDLFRIERINGQIKSYKNGTLLHTSATASTGPLFLDTGFNSAGDSFGNNTSLHDLRIYAPGPDSDADGISDAWEYQHFTSLDSSTQSGGLGFENDFDRDGISNLQESFDQTDPKDYYNGVLPDLRIVSGDRQETLPSAVLPQPLVIEVRDSPSPSAPLLPDAPVVFSLPGFIGNPRIGLSPSGPFNLTTTSVLRSDTTTGQVQVWLQQPAGNMVTTTVRAAATSGANTTFKDFKAFTTYVVGYWKFDETTWDTSFLDSSTIPTPANGTLTNYPPRVEGLGGSGTYSVTDKALSFDGTAKYGNVPTNTKLNLNQNGTQFSIAVWLQTPALLPLGATTDQYPILSKWASGSIGYEFGLKGGSANGLSFRMLNSAGSILKDLQPGSDQRALLSDGRPHLVVVTRDASSVGRLYVDGVVVGSLSGMTESMSNSTPLSIAKVTAGTSTYFNGVLDDLRYWARELSAPEVLAMRQAFDSDNDGLPDAWELKYFSTLANSGTDDNDAGGPDGLTNAQEYTIRSNPTLADTDGDGLTDFDELTGSLSAILTDTDGDGMSDGDEVANGMDPTVAATEDTAGAYLQLTVYTPLQ